MNGDADQDSVSAATEETPMLLASLLGTQGIARRRLTVLVRDGHRRHWWRASKPCCIMVASAAEAQAWMKLGASAFIVSSDQGFLRQAEPLLAMAEEA